jgi:hypothetical protein
VSTHDNIHVPHGFYVIFYWNLLHFGAEADFGSLMLGDRLMGTPTVTCHAFSYVQPIGSGRIKERKTYMKAKHMCSENSRNKVCETFIIYKSTTKGEHSCFSMKYNDDELKDYKAGDVLYGDLKELRWVMVKGFDIPEEMPLFASEVQSLLITSNLKRSKVNKSDKSALDMSWMVIASHSPENVGTVTEEGAERCFIRETL